MAVDIQKTLSGGRNTDNLIKSTCFYLKISRVHVFYSNLVDSTYYAMTIVKTWYESLHIPGFPGFYVFQNLTKNQELNT